MLRAILPKPRTLLGCIPLETGVSIVASGLIIWNIFGIATGYSSAWVLYNVWMLVSSIALFYGLIKKDYGHARWFAIALFLDILVYLAYIPYDPEFTMTDTESCSIAMVTNRDMTMEYCLDHIHEIKNIAYMMRVAAVLTKCYLAGLAKSYEDTIPPPLAKRARKKRRAAAPAKTE
ncbi:hypothetical protein GGI12_003959 [Dipsacomyces acuminosporus]|nr:hypothetical protein GGI12_003959 [Dipsacomyces acuminosporus]